MKKLTVLLLACLIFGGKLVAQTTDGTMPGYTNNTNKKRVLIIPFEPKLYISDIDNELIKENELSGQKELRAKMRAALDQNIYLSFNQMYDAFSFYTIPQDEAIKELSYIYNSIGYKYEPLPKEEHLEKESTGKKLLNKFKKKEQPVDEKKEGVINGEVVSISDNQEKYMQTKISNDNLLPTLNKTYFADYYLFINELDIKRSVNNAYSVDGQYYKREMKVHYTIFDNAGNIIDSGAVKTLFPPNNNDFNKIVKTQFMMVAQELLNRFNNHLITN